MEYLMYLTAVWTHVLNPLSANPTKWSKKLKQFVGNLATNCLSVFDHYVGLALKGLRYFHDQGNLFDVLAIKTCSKDSPQAVGHLLCWDANNSNPTQICLENIFFLHSRLVNLFDSLRVYISQSWYLTRTLVHVDVTKRVHEYFEENRVCLLKKKHGELMED